MSDEFLKTPDTKATFLRPHVNSRTRVTIVPVFKDRELAPPTGSPGEYEAVFVLGVPGKVLFHESLDIPLLVKSGDSLLAMPPETVEIRCDIGGEQGNARIRFLPNAHNRIARAEMKFQAPSFAEAEQVAWNLISDMLSVWSFRHDSAVDISGYQIRQVESQTLLASFGILGAPKVLDINFGGPSTKERRSLLAAYREGTNATNPFYQFLSFFKVVEGVHKLRVQRRQSTPKKASRPSEPVERFPETADAFPTNLADRAETLSGKRYNAVIDDMRATVRNALAHLNPLEDHLTADRFSDIAQCSVQIETLRFIARHMLLSELNLPITPTPSK